MKNKLFDKEFEVNSSLALGDMNSQINSSINTIKVEGNHYPWDPMDSIFYIDDSIMNTVSGRKKGVGLLKNQDCTVCETGISKIKFNEKFCDFCGKLFCNDC